MRITKEKCLNLWNNAPIKKFLDYHPKEADTSREDGVVLTDDWARVMYLLQEYSGGGYWSATLVGIMAFWGALGCRCNVPAILKEISKIVDDDLDQNGKLNSSLRELCSILEVIKEKTGFKLEKTEFKSKDVSTLNSLRQPRRSFVDTSSLQDRGHQEIMTFN